MLKINHIMSHNDCVFILVLGVEVNNTVDEYTVVPETPGKSNTWEQLKGIQYLRTAGKIKYLRTARRILYLRTAGRIQYLRTAGRILYFRKDGRIPGQKQYEPAKSQHSSASRSSLQPHDIHCSREHHGAITKCFHVLLNSQKWNKKHAGVILHIRTYVEHTAVTVVTAPL